MGSVRYVRAEDVVWRQNPGEVVLLARGDDVVRLSGTGNALWDLLARPRSLDELVSRLAPAYSAVPEQVASEVRPVLDELVRRQAVARLPGG